MNIEIGSNEAGQRLDKFLRKLLKDVPLSAIYKALRKGDVKINGSKKNEKYQLQLGDEVVIRDITTSRKKEYNFQKVNADHLKITYEDENMLLVEKWPNILVHSDKKGGEPTLTDFVLTYLNEKGDYLPEKEVTFTPASCNRLDRNTSGIVIFGKNFDSLKILNEMIRERKIKKYYMALVKGKIKPGIYEGYIKKDEANNVSKIYNDNVKNSKKIAMDINVIQTDGLYSLIEIELITGRSHQLRAHLSHLGYPIIGDAKYGDSKVNTFFINKYGLNYQFLYAYKVIFRNCGEKLAYLENKTIAESLPPIFKKIKNDVFKVVIR
ncbi:23S rRNA pseudouridine955/2504/2580 synthase [Clostridium amylolyticum]|uniref:Pseudouridine synthase n=1 Tax=Clostridium amylolyticum TaxID=1121298 RepID=A0A1M6MPV7_9CLOT|nr:RluA family pseudouridine synthase [Clostridium amylolyticum]SHJ85511.1 23S rRNA pseudouridine955/2504/2580 synthase [Clostridium amylolyticum]